MYEKTPIHTGARLYLNLKGRIAYNIPGIFRYTPFMDKVGAYVKPANPALNVEGSKANFPQLFLMSL
jgi:hypothetical protein